MKGTFIFMLGAAVGAAASYFITSRSIRKQADEEIEAVRIRMTELQKDNDILKDVRRKAEENYNKPFTPIVEPEEPVTPSEDVIPNQEIDYSAISRKTGSSSPVIKKNGITEISQNEYFNYINNKNYSETTFTFYQGDNTLVDDETGMAVHDPEKYVGASGVDAMSKLTVEETYFVDEDNSMINCITIAEDSYYDENTIEEV